LYAPEKKGRVNFREFFEFGIKKSLFIFLSSFEIFLEKKIALTHTLFHRVCGNYFPDPTPKSM
jgi:hypothetical protein